MIQARYSADPTIIECGCDEVGRGCIAGPVYAAAVVFPTDYYNAAINDSKQLSRSQREQLRTEFTALLEDWDPRDVIHHCGSGVSACHNLLAMALAGLGDARLYPGSWSEWSADPARPVARG